MPELPSFLDWWHGRGVAPERPWLLLGKGPSFSRRGDFDLTPYLTLGLNHACRAHAVTVAHAIDLEVVDDLGEVLLDRAEVLVMPWVPHVRRGGPRAVLTAPTRLSPVTLAEAAGTHPILSRLAADGRLLWYNLGTAPASRPGTPVVPVQFFSAEAALGLLAAAGATTVRSLGIDGGASYSSEFADLADRTLLANGRRSFDRQFEAIADVLCRTGLDYAPLDHDAPARVFVAATDAQRLAVRVLESSLRAHASLSVAVRSLHDAGITIPTPANPRHRPRTPFSFQRFLIPEVAGRRGRAISLDSDMQVFRDIRELWTRPMGEADVLAVREDTASGGPPQFSVMVLDCARLDWGIEDIVARLDAGTLDYDALMFRLAIAGRVSVCLDAAWNRLDRFEAGRTALLHYTDMRTQPWIDARHPFGYLWVRGLLDAMRRGWITREDVAAEVTAGHVRPSLLYQVDEGVEDAALLPNAERARDADFVAPYQVLPSAHRAWAGVLQPVARLRAYVRDRYRRSPVASLEARVRERLSR